MLLVNHNEKEIFFYHIKVNYNLPEKSNLVFFLFGFCLNSYFSIYSYCAESMKFFVKHNATLTPKCFIFISYPIPMHTVAALPPLVNPGRSISTKPSSHLHSKLVYMYDPPRSSHTALSGQASSSVAF